MSFYQRSLISLCAVAVFYSPRMYAQTSAVDSSVKENAAIRWITGTVHDFGKIKQGEPVTFTFEFINRGREAITISRGKVECSCMSIAYNDKSIAGGEKGEIKIGYNAHSAGPFSKDATIVFSNHEQFTLKISGEVIQ